MRRVLPFMMVCMVVLCAAFGYSEIFVVYSSGDSSVDLLGNGNWVDAEVDMELGTSSVVKTGQDGAVEIDLDGELISIGPNGYTALDGLLGKVEKKKKVGFLKGLKKYTKQMSSSSDKYTETALAGVRGAVHDEDELEWFDEDDLETDLEQTFAEGLNHFNRGAYTAAIDLFTSLVDEFGEQVLEGEVSYYLGISLFNVMRFDESASYLEVSLHSDDAEFHDVALMHLSVSRYFLRDYNDAIDGFMFFADEEAESDLKPYALIMLGKCYREKGELREAEHYFREVTSGYEGTEFSDTATEELQSIGSN